MPLRISPLDPSSTPWRDLASRGLGATSYHHPDLVLAVATAYGLQPGGWAVFDGDDMIGGLVVLRAPKQRAEPLPIVPFNGPVIRPSPSPYQSTRDRHIARILRTLFDEVATSMPWCLIRMSTETGDVRELLSNGWSLRPTFTYTMEIADIERAWHALDPNRRRLVRRGEANGYFVESLESLGRDPALLVRSLAGLRTMQLRTYGVNDPPDLEAWRHLIEHLLATRAGRLFVVRSPDGEPVAFQLMSVGAGSAGNMLTGSDPAHAERGSNSLLRWRAAQALAAERIRRVDLNGARSGDTGRFKASLGAVITERWDLRRPTGIPPRLLILEAARRVRRDFLSLRTARK